MNKKYRIAWRSILTGTTGYGEPVFWSRTIASHVAKQLDEDSPDKLHWVVPADESVASDVSTTGDVPLQIGDTSL
jgi:hypothetical protein